MIRSFFLFISVAMFVSAIAHAQTNQLGYITNPSLRYIVRLREGTDLDGFLTEFKLKPRHQYRHALHGFAMELDATMVERLKREPRILDVEPDGHVVLCSQTPST
ncbi:MAG TPA: protease inhibitor I9 family protein, partial [Candidatus Acidoferrum sp.]|nr:protease inhibitor I9 family protein [Candidatus Acidoferrum sp.]